MKRRHITEGVGRMSTIVRGIVILASVVIGACSDARRSSTLDLAATEVSPEETALAQFAAAFATSMRDDNLRNRLNQRLRGSTFKEQKLGLLAYLEREPETLTAISRRLATAPADVLKLVRDLGPLEFYLPVPQHRAGWHGGRELLIAAQHREGAMIYGFDLSGRAVRMTEAEVPVSPTVVIVSAETDFSTELTDTKDRAVAMSANTSAVASLPGIYMSYAYLNDLHEPWTRGEPELEVMVIAPTLDGQASELYPNSCANQSRSGRKFYDQDHKEWFGDLDGDAQDDVLVVDSLQLIDAKNRYSSSVPDSSRSILIQWWEDDTERCVIYTDAYRDAGGVSATLALAGLTIGIVVDCLLGGCYDPDNPYVAGATALALFNQLNKLLSSNDDFIGTATIASSWNAKTGDIVVRTHAIVRDSVISGRTGVTNLHWRPRGYYGQ